MNLLFQFHDFTILTIWFLCRYSQIYSVLFTLHQKASILHALRVDLKVYKPDNWRLDMYLSKLLLFLAFYYMSGF